MTTKLKAKAISFLMNKTTIFNFQLHSLVWIRFSYPMQNYFQLSLTIRHEAFLKIALLPAKSERTTGKMITHHSNNHHRDKRAETVTLGVATDPLTGHRVITARHFTKDSRRKSKLYKDKGKETSSGSSTLAGRALTLKHLWWS